MNKKIIFGVIGIVIFVELIWAWQTLGWTLPGTQQKAPETVIFPSPTPLPSARIELNSAKTSYKVGEEIDVTVDISSAVPTNGADVILKFDSNVLSAMAIETAPLYEDYPQKTVDGKAGLIAISGITGAEGGTVPNGKIASVFFKAVKAGRTSITVDFTRDKTTDSNVVGVGVAKDLLSEVKDLTLEITP